MTYVTAPIHDLLIRIKNAYMARKTLVDDVGFSNFKVKYFSKFLNTIVKEELCL